MRVVNTNVTSTTTAVVIASTSIRVKAPVSARIRKWATVMSEKISRAMALPIEAIASSLNTSARTRHATASNSSPAASRPPNLRAINGGNWPVSARRSDSPCAG